MRYLAVLALMLLAGCTATMKYHMAANEVQADKNLAWVRWGCDAESHDCTLPRDQGFDHVELATKSAFEDCAGALGETAIVTPSLADARRQIELCLVRQGYERLTVSRIHPDPQEPCTKFYPPERCPMPVEPKP